MASTDLRTAHRGAQRAIAVILPFLVAAGLAALHGGLTTATSVLVLVLVVVGVGAAGDRVAGLLAAVSSGLWFDVFLTEPTGQLTIKDPDDVEVAVLLVVVGIAVTEIAHWGLRQQARAARRAGFLDGVLESAEVAAGSDVDVDDARRRVAARITGVLGLDRCRFVAGPPPGRGVAILRRDGTVERSGAPLPVEREGLPTDVEIVLPVPGPAVGLGHFRLTAASRVLRPSLEQRRVAVLLAAQCASLPDRRDGAEGVGRAGCRTSPPRLTRTTRTTRTTGSTRPTRRRCSRSGEHSAGVAPPAADPLEPSS